MEECRHGVMVGAADGKRVACMECVEEENATLRAELAASREREGVLRAAIQRKIASGEALAWLRINEADAHRESRRDILREAIDSTKALEAAIQQAAPPAASPAPEPPDYCYHCGHAPCERHFSCPSVGAYAVVLPASIVPGDPPRTIRVRLTHTGRSKPLPCFDDSCSPPVDPIDRRIAEEQRRAYREAICEASSVTDAPPVEARGEGVE